MENTNETINIGFFGSPNSGKSTLFNELLQAHIAIISDKPQTTEKITDGMISIDNFAIKLIDTPGISFIKQTGMRGYLNQMSWDVLKDIEYTFFLVPANKPYIQQEFLDKAKNFIVIITKIDMVKKQNLPLIIERINDLYSPKDILCVSAKYNIGVDRLLNYFLSLPHRKNATPQEELLLNTEMFITDYVVSQPFTSISNEDLAIDMTREAIFTTLKNEVPYHITIENLQWEEGVRGVHIHQQLLLPNIHYKLILFGNNHLNHIKKQSAEQLSKLLNKEIFLRITVKVQKKR